MPIFLFTKNSDIANQEEITSYAMPSTYWSANIDTDFALGDGSSSAPWQISSAEELAGVASLINSGAYSAWRSDYYELTADIDLSTHLWTPIGSYTSTTYFFNGNFNGNNHIIDGLTINSGTYVGLFGYVRDASAKIYGINLTNVYIEASGSSSGGIGGIVGYALFNIAISGCSVEGS
ncbi:MAG: hypothetical protein WC942_09215, partial [Clostridia bacterium]